MIYENFRPKHFVMSESFCNFAADLRLDAAI